LSMQSRIPSSIRRSRRTSNASSIVRIKPVILFATPRRYSRGGRLEVRARRLRPLEFACAIPDMAAIPVCEPLRHLFPRAGTGEVGATRLMYVSRLHN
jgi:hypothetical protein